MDLIFGVLTLFFGVYALIKGQLQLSKKYVLEGNSAKFAGGLLVIAPIIGLILTLNGQVDSAIFGCSCYSIIGVLAFAAFQMWKSKSSPQVKTQIINEPEESGKKESAQTHVAKTQPAASSVSYTQRMSDTSFKARTEQKKLPPDERIEPTPICPKCGNIGLPKDKFCRKCGSPIKSEIHCKKCGNIVQPKDLFCVKCGSRLGSKSVAADHNESATPMQKQSSKSVPPISRKQQRKTPVASANPFTADVVIKSGTLLFKCPTCPNNISVSLQNIDPIAGISVLCSSCKNIIHVPGIYKTEPKPAGMRITGGIRVPIAKFSDWYYEHPYIVSLINNKQSDLLFDYGLWAFCNTCHHQYSSTVLNYFAMAQATYFSDPNSTDNFAFPAQTPESANDMAALRSGHCSHCQDKNLFVIVTEIPDYVRAIIASKRK